MNRQQTEDLKAFENRLTECVTYASKRTLKWKVLVIAASISTMMSFWSWIRDGSSYVRSPFFIKPQVFSWFLKTSYMEMLYTHWWLLVNLLFMFSLYLLGACDKYNAQKLISRRCKTVLQDYNMSCDDQGKLILKKSKRHSQPLTKDWKNTTPG